MGSRDISARIWEVKQDTLADSIQRELSTVMRMELQRIHTDQFSRHSMKFQDIMGSVSIRIGTKWEVINSFYYYEDKRIHAIMGDACELLSWYRVESDKYNICIEPIELGTPLE